MGKRKISIAGILLFFLIPTVMPGLGCTYQRRHFSSPLGMPEEVYIGASVQKYYTPDIAVIEFQSTDYGWRLGEKASRLLYAELLKSDLKANIFYDNTAGSSGPDELARFAWKNKYDYIVTGEILHFLNGGISVDSRVEQEIKIYSVTGGRLQAVGYAKATETSSPLHSTDFVLIGGRGTSAMSAEGLLKRNTGKFARLLCGMFSENGAADR